jgi:hypothetical protein
MTSKRSCGLICDQMTVKDMGSKSLSLGDLGWRVESLKHSGVKEGRMDMPRKDKDVFGRYIGQPWRLWARHPTACCSYGIVIDGGEWER